MPRLKITKKMPVATDGIHITLFHKDQIIPDASEELKKLLVDKLKMAEVVRERKPVEPSVIPIVEPSETKDETKDETDETEDKEIDEEIVEDEADEGLRVYEMAKKYSVPNRAILNAVQKLKFEATAPASVLTAKQVLEIKEYLEI